MALVAALGLLGAGLDIAEAEWFDAAAWGAATAYWLLSLEGLRRQAEAARALAFRAAAGGQIPEDAAADVAAAGRPWFRASLIAGLLVVAAILADTYG